MIDRDKPILLTGATGMVGGVTRDLLERSGFSRILAPSRRDLDLTDPTAVDAYFACERPAYVLMVGARVGGIAANMQDPVGFTDVNLRINLNLFSACHRYGTEKNLFLGSSCIYPLGHAGLIPETALLSGPLEPTNEGYALSKIIGLKLARYYWQQHGLLTVCPMLSNVYGTGDHFDLGRAHVLSSLVRRFVDARDSAAASVTLWGTGIARREFLHSEDAARAILFFMDHVDQPDHINVGLGTDVTIHELAGLIAQSTGFHGEIGWDTSKPDGMLRKCMDTSKLQALGFAPQVSLAEGIHRTIAEYETIKSTGALTS
jgi:GDP-L-fucose synthase